MASVQTRDNQASMVRLLIVGALFGAGTMLVSTGAHRGGVFPADWLGGRQRLLTADLSYRIGQVFLLWSSGAGALGQNSWQLRERAVAAYERQALAAVPSAAALHRLGIIYGERGYDDQAHAALMRAATLDPRRASLYFSQATMFDPESPPSRLAAPPDEAPGLQEQWLTDIINVTWARQHGDMVARKQYTDLQDEHLSAFALRMLRLMIAYGLLALLGAVVLLRAVVRGLFVLSPRSKPRPFVLPWSALDGLEVAGVLFFTMVLLALGSGVLQQQPFARDAAPLVRALLLTAHYLLLAAVPLVLIALKTPLPGRQRLAALGLRAPRLGVMVATGLLGYGVVLCLMALISLAVPSAGPGPDPLAVAANDPLLAMARDPGAVVVLYLLICLVAPVVEEIIFRGFLYGGLRQTMPAFVAVIGSALVFALMHQNLVAALPIGIIGIVLAYLYERSRSLLPAIVCHSLHNLLVLTMILLVQ